MTMHPELILNPETQLVTVDDPSPTVSILWDRASQLAVIETKVGPTVASRAYGIVHSAMFDAWAAYDETAIATQLGDELQRPGDENTDANKTEAMSFAAYRVLTELFPSQVGIFDEVMAELGFDPSDLTTDTTTAAGIGNVSAEALMEVRREDGSNQLSNYADTTDYTPVNTSDTIVDIEHWTAERVPIDSPDAQLQNFLTPKWGDVDPFGIGTGEALRPPAPQPFLLVDDATADVAAQTITLADGTVLDITPDLVGTIINPEFIAQAEAVVELSANLNNEQKLIAEFWEDGGGTSFPPGTWMTFGQFVSAREDHSLDEDAQLFFSLGNAVFDAGVATWEAKVFYDYVRPVRAIRSLGELGLIGEFNADLGGFAIDAWAGPEQGTQTILATDFTTYQTPGSDPSPPFAEYTSGHSAFSAAGATILELFSGSDDFGADITFASGESRFEPGFTPQSETTLLWDTFADAADEAGLSRLYGGIHFEEGDVNGRILGQEVGAAVFETAQFFINGGEEQNFFIGTRERDRFVGTEADESIYGRSGDDRLRGNLGDDQIFGGDGNDRLWGDLRSRDQEGGDDTIYGGTGDDPIRGNGGDDKLFGNHGDDRLRGDGGDDLLRGGMGNDRLRGDFLRSRDKEGGDDTIYGGAGDDLIRGNGGDDKLFGNHGDDRLRGDGGDDLLRGGMGNDRLRGDLSRNSGGEDTFVLAVGEGTDTIKDFAIGEDLIGLADGLVFDQLVITQQTRRRTVIEVADETLAILKNVDADELIGSAESSFVIVEPDDAPDDVDPEPDMDEVLGDATDNIFDAADPSDRFDGDRDTVLAGAGNDLIDASQSSAGHNQIYGELGADELLAGTHDELFGGEGNDILDASVGTGHNMLFGDQGNDELLAGEHDQLYGGEGDDLLDSSLGNGNNQLHGQNGNDTLMAGRSDQLLGGDGDDSFFITDGGDNRMTGGAGADAFWIATGEFLTSANSILDFNVDEDVIGVAGLGATSVKDLEFSASGANTLISFSGIDLAVVQGTSASVLASDAVFVFA